MDYEYNAAQQRIDTRYYLIKDGHTRLAEVFEPADATQVLRAAVRALAIIEIETERCSPESLGGNYLQEPDATSIIKAAQWGELNETWNHSNCENEEAVYVNVQQEGKDVVKNYHEYRKSCSSL